MLKPLLLLCWTAIFVSAGDQQIDGINSTGVSVDSSQKNVIGQPELLLDNTKPATSSSEHVSSVQSEPLSNPPKLSDSSPDTKLKMSAPLASNEDIHATSIIKNANTSTTTTTTTTSTTPSSTTTSTTSTTTTTTAPTTTTSAPTTPVPPPSIKKWMVRQDNKTCIIVQMAAQFNFSYTVNNKTIQKMMDIPGTGNGTASGICGDVEQNLTVSWDAQKDTDNFTLHFVKNETTKHYSLHHFEISLAPEEFPADKWNETVTLIHMTPQYEIGLSNSYRCIKEQRLNLYMKDVNETVGHLTISKLQFQAFRGDNSTSFGLAKDCAFETPDIVPITVGCALAGLVVIVLIAYLVGRRRSQARGYLSM
ncbi:lysosome-associated membrane glycoprotein 1 [Odontomachus brunneus]|uniref:lysosome-associated membrane glycoprotein 1 n=1 Tax=Odontomachus brunneus TaxID=486640 RepID=UPI0013F29599|nr:lysosome-associated membrane glycoprotein 1 [Odontomachus brunneus]